MILDVMFPENPVALASSCRGPCGFQFPALPILMLTAIWTSRCRWPLAAATSIRSCCRSRSSWKSPWTSPSMCDKLDRLLQRPTHATEENA